jgi:type IV pilus assembly protein PilY1
MRATAKALWAFTLVACIGGVTPTRADDTDIYVEGGVGEGTQPLVMFVLDYRPNLASAVCGGSTAEACSKLWASVGETMPAKPVFLDLLRVALKSVFKPLTNVKVGLMINHNLENNCAGPDKTGCSNGAYVLRGFKSFTTADASDPSKVEFLNKLANLPTIAGSFNGHPYQGKQLYFELFRYLTGQGIYNGHNGWTDYNTDARWNINTTDDQTDAKGNPVYTCPASPGTPCLIWDPTIESGANYISPLTQNCSKVYVINLMFQVTDSSGPAGNSDAAITAPKGAGGMAGIVLSGGGDNQFDQVLKWMYDIDLADGSFGTPPTTVPNLRDKQNVTSYFLYQANPSKPLDTGKVNGYAQAGGTNHALPLSTDPDALVATFTNTFAEILSVSTTFVAASVPVNVFNRAEIIDNVYIAVFQADPARLPRWPGDVKKLKIGKVSGVDTLVAANTPSASCNDAVSSTDGRINQCALTFWTVPGSLPAPDTTQTPPEVAGADGRSPNRGGAGQKIPGMAGSATTNPGLLNTDPNARQLFTEPDTYTNGTPTTMLALDANATTAGTLWNELNADKWSGSANYASAGPTDQATAVNLLKYARGIDPNPTPPSTASPPLIQMIGRDWLMGDAMHSRPLPVNYGAHGGHTKSNPDIRILVGSNDGFMRMINNTASDGTEDGREVWAFMPRAVMHNLNRLNNDTPPPPAPIHPYGVDGAAAVYLDDANQDGTIESGEKVYVYFGLRRGGRAVYAVDVSDPDQPKLLWVIKNTTPGFSELGLTFSNPRVGKIDYGSTCPSGSPPPCPVVIFAGGYDTNKDSRTSPYVVNEGTDDSMGRALYVVDGQTGALVWKAEYGGSTACGSSTTCTRSDLHDSIPSDVSAVDTTGNGLIDRVYVGDTGGVVWRADLAGNDPSKWTLTPVLSVGRHAHPGDRSQDRRFFHRPDVVQSRDDGGAFDAVVVGSGDRANPLDAEVNDRVYMLKDRNISSGTPPSTVKTDSDLADLTDDCFQKVPACTTLPAGLADGWFIDLANLGEKSLATPTTIAGTVYFTTYVPAGEGELGETTCVPEGSGFLYAVALQDARAVINYNTTNDADHPDTQGLGVEDRVVELSSPGIPAEVVLLPPDEILRPDLSIEKVHGGTAWRTFWYERGR